MNQWFEPGHVAIVTGGSRGLGKELARELLKLGLHVIVDGRDGKALVEARTELAAFGDILAVAGDVTDPEHVHALFEAAHGFGRLDLLVNNASTLGATPLPVVTEIERHVLEYLFLTNVIAPVHLMQHAAIAMERNTDAGTIVNVTSDAAVEAYPGWGGYGASKAALEHLSQVFAEERLDARIRVLVADPGDMDTQMHREAVPGADPAALRDPADSARALLQAVAAMTHRFERVQLAELVHA